MNAPHLHLILNHVPILFCFVGLGILSYGILLRDETVQRIAMVLFLLTGLSVIPVYYSGSYAEETVEELDGVQEEPIEQHEEAAEISTYLALLLGALSLGGLSWQARDRSVPRWYGITMIVVGVVVFVSFVKTANQGGMIRHPEINLETGLFPAHNHEHVSDHE